ncbi:AP-3 complex subunit delta [Platanthera guangdongensis]|uniref:AP-3 complex subunit delta n=1 Tax=Platanthera guangdongensis TaxID=2320717 RepID=A0ABR2N002_9ASPA
MAAEGYSAVQTLASYAAGYSPIGSKASPAGGFAPLVDSLFQRSLDDMIKALRTASDAESLIHRLLTEIRREIRSTDSDTKCIALLKLTYLSSLHSLDMSWAAFHAVELLPSPFPAVKRAGYLCASLSFHPSSTDLLPLVTHQLRKDLQSPNTSISSPALHLLAISSSPDLSIHLSNDLLSLFSSSRASSHVRCRSVATSLPVIRLNPDSSTIFLPKLVEALSPSSPLLSAAVSVFCELVSSGNPRPYLHLAPDFHRVLIECRNNWVLIKIIKIFARLILLEPRLTRKLVDPICDLMGRSPAKSLVLECIRIVFSSFPEPETPLKLAVEKVKEFVAADDDPNLRFLGLHTLTLLRPGQSWAVEENREAIVKSLADPDPNIRQEALRLITTMVFENNLVEISAILINYSSKSDPEFSNEILEAILATCSRNFYELVMDFDWYVSLLAEMVRNPHFMKGEEVERQLVDIALRVKEARPELVRVARNLLIDPALLENPLLHRVHSAVAWISGEFIKFSRNPMEILEALLQPRTSFLPSLVRAVYIQAVFKVVTFCFISFMNVGRISDSKSDIDKNTDAASEDGSDEALFKKESLGVKELLTSKSILYMLNLILKELSPLSECDEVEVQERARNVLGFVHTLNEIDWNREEEQLRSDIKVREIVNFMNAVFSEELGPISIHAQKRVPLPEGIELKENLNDLVEILGNHYIAPSPLISFSTRTQNHNEVKQESEPAAESSSLLAEHRKRHGLYYLSTTKDEDGSSDYPRATDLTKSVHSHSMTEDLLMLTAQSSVPRLTKPSKPRPTVVKLDEFDDSPSSSSKHAKEPQRDVLFVNEKPHSDNYTQRLVKETSTASNVDSLSKEKSLLGEGEITSSSSRKEKHNSRGNHYVVPSPLISFSTRTQNHNEVKQESEPAAESSSLLAEHRKRHELYYLSTMKDEDGSSDYPRATDLTKSVHSHSMTEDLLKLTAQSSVPRLTKPSKPRPTVVKLDEFDDSPSSSSKHAKEPQRDVLFVNEKPHSDNYTQRLVKETSTASNVDSLSKEKSLLGEGEITSSSSRKEKHNSRGKERQRSTKKSESKEGKSHRSSTSSSHHRGRHKHKQGREPGDTASNIAPKAPVFEDFLL